MHGCRQVLLHCSSCEDKGCTGHTAMYLSIVKSISGVELLELLPVVGKGLTSR